jgi:RNA polymerase sigma-70 factor (ECF subfamily)
LAIVTYPAIGDSGVAMDDRELLSRWRTGDNAAGRTLFARFGPTITGYFQRKVFVTTDVRSLVNETFFACITTRTPFEGTAEAVRPYLFGIAHNKLREHLRRCRAADRRHADGVDPDDFAELSLDQIDPRDPSDFAERREDRKLILKALRRIPLDYQLVFELSFWEGLSNSEIAEALELPVGTVATRLRIGKERLEREVKALARTPALLQTTTMTLASWVEQVQAYARGRT